MHRPAELDLRTIGSDSFGLEVEQDQARHGAIGNADPAPIPCPSGLYQQRCSVSLAPPQRLLNTLMRQAGHGEPCMGDAEPGNFLGHNRRSRLHGLPVGPAFSFAAGAFQAFPKNQLMYLTHGPG
jgi:hypothetical protein